MTVKEKIKWTLEKKNLSEVFELNKNPRLMTSSQRQKLLTCIEEFGLIDKPIINLDGQIIGGHQRIRILLDYGEPCVECWIPNRLLTEREVEVLCLSLNKNSGDWDWEKLANDFDIETLLKAGFEAKDFHDQKIDKKPKVIIEFNNREDLEKALDQIQGIEHCKIKVKL